MSMSRSFSPVICGMKPDKQLVLQWTAGSPIGRKADLMLKEDGKSYASVVDIASHLIR
jgi:hypothetical protein